MFLLFFPSILRISHSHWLVWRRFLVLDRVDFGGVWKGGEREVPKMVLLQTHRIHVWIIYLH